MIHVVLTLVNFWEEYRSLMVQPSLEITAELKTTFNTI